MREVSGSNSVKVVLDGDGEMQSIKISEEIMREDKTIIEDLIVAAHNLVLSHNLKQKQLRKFQKQQVDLEYLDLNGHYSKCKISLK